MVGRVAQLVTVLVVTLFVSACVLKKSPKPAAHTPPQIGAIQPADSLTEHLHPPKSLSPDTTKAIEDSLAKIDPSTRDSLQKGGAPLELPIDKRERDSLHTESHLPTDSLGDTNGLGLEHPLKEGSQADSLMTDSLAQTGAKEGFSQQEPIEEDDDTGDLDDIVEYSAQDSMVMLGSNLVYLFGPSVVTYQQSSIKANYMRINADSSTVYSQYVLDSLGRAIAIPTFKDGGQEFTARTINYNFNTSKGFITGTRTVQGEGNIIAGKAKKQPDDNLHMQDGKYTTCDADHPHFYINLTKAKVRPNKDIVAGPAYMVIADVPIPILGLPFAYFPLNSQKYSSGVIMPKYGEDSERGFFLRDGGYYFALNDYVDLALTGEIYTKGSWGVKAQSKYNWRYKFSGSLDLGYLQTVRGLKVDPNYSKQRDFFVNWRHTQDSKFKPQSTFAASVNFSTSNFDRNDVENIHSNNNSYAQNTKSSSISYSHRFKGTPFSISASFDITQRTADSTISITLPNLNIAMSTIYPFKRKKRIGGEKWFEKIQMSYSGQLRNSIQTREDKLLKSNLIKDWKNAMQHSVPISATFTLFDYIQLTPSISYRERWYTNRSSKAYDPNTDRLVKSDTTYGFYRVYDFNAALSMSTTVYGYFKPWKIFGDKVEMIRHRLTPSLTFSWAPDFSSKPFNFYRDIEYFDRNGVYRYEKYSLYEGALFGTPGMGKQGVINLSFANNIEAKVRTKIKRPGGGLGPDGEILPDSIGTRKQSIIDNFNWGLSYNMAADSMRWSDINASLTFRFTSKFAFTLSGQFEPYMYDARIDDAGNPRPYKVNKLRILNGRGLARLRSTGTSFSYTLNNSTWQKIRNVFGGSKKDGEDLDNEGMGGSSMTRPESDFGAGMGRPGGAFSEGRGDTFMYDEDGYLQNSIPWSLTLNYTMSLGYDMQKFDIKKMEYPRRFTHNLSFNGHVSPSPNWNFSLNGNYNFSMKRFTDIRLSLTRDMHCWQLTGSVVPVGYNKSYILTISVKSSLLKDLKWQQQSAPQRMGSSWY